MNQSIPAWVVPNGQEVIDCGQLAAAVGDSEYETGVAAAIVWTTGRLRTPITGEERDPVRHVAEAEWFAAGEVELGRSPRGAMVPVPTAQGARRTLAWLLGREQRPPIPLPRHPVPTPEELYAEALAAEPHRSWLPEERQAARSSALREAARLAQLADRADSLSS
jgi:hypothetical protein